MTGVIIQARMGSERLPGKVLKLLNGKTMIEHVVERAQSAKTVDMVVVATTDTEKDLPLVNFLKEKNIRYFCGSENDVLKRYIDTAVFYEIDTVVRVTSDCPLVDPDMLDYVVKKFIDSKVDYAENCRLERTCPRGLDVEVVKLDTLKSIYLKDLKPYEKEHVTIHIYENKSEFSLLSVKPLNEKINRPDLRLTVDTEEDYLLMKTIYEKLYNGEKLVDIYDVIELLDSDDKVKSLNANITQKVIIEGKSY